MTKKKKLQTLFSKTGSAYDKADATNYEGAPAFVRDDYEAVVRVLTVGTFEPTFYASARVLSQQALSLFAKMTRDDPHFLAQAIVYAREKGLMRTAPITALVVLSTGGDDAKEMFRRIFPRVIRTPGDAQDFALLIRNSKLRGSGRLVHTALQHYLSNLSEYHVIKYGSEKQMMSLRDMFRLARPKFAQDSRRQQLASYVVKGTLPTDLEQIRGYEAFKAAAASPDTSIDALYRLVYLHNIPWEVATTQLPANEASWRAMYPQMPYMALLRNLRNLDKYGVLRNPEDLNRVCATLSNTERVLSSRQLPFRFLSAIKALDDEAPWKLRQALDEALELSFANMPTLGQRILICNDVSGSMDMRASEHSEVRMNEIASVFAAALYKKSEVAQIVSFAECAIPRTNISRDMSMRSIARAIVGEGGGTDLSAPLTWAMGSTASHEDSLARVTSGAVTDEAPATEQTFDTMVFITDSESWADHIRGSGALDQIRKYKVERNKDLKCFFLQLLPYEHAVVPPDEPDCYYLYGWSNEVVSYINGIVNGGLTQVESVRQESVM